MEDKVLESISQYFTRFDPDHPNSICYIAADSNLVVSGIVLLIASYVTFKIYRKAG